MQNYAGNLNRPIGERESFIGSPEFDPIKAIRFPGGADIVRNFRSDRDLFSCIGLTKIYLQYTQKYYIRSGAMAYGE